MTVRPHSKKLNHYIIDCRPDGYKGNRVRLIVEGKDQAIEAHDILMRKDQEFALAPAVMSVSSIYRQWIVYYRNNRAKRTADDAEDCWKNLGPHFGKISPRAITQALIESFKTKMSIKVKPRTTNKHLAYFSSMLSWATDNGMCKQLPFRIKGYEKNMTRAPKPRPLSQKQITTIYNLIAQEYKLVFLLMADAGLRRNEALQLKAKDVDVEQGIIFILGKGSKERVVPIFTDRLRKELTLKLELINPAKNANKYLTFNSMTGKPYLTIRKALLRAVKEAKIDKHVSHHLLRHSFGTNATIAGMSQKSLQLSMGHSSVVTTGIYQHLSAEYLRAEGAKFNAKIEKSDHMDTFLK